MKQLLLTLILLVSSFNLISQETDFYSTIQLVEPQNFSLESKYNNRSKTTLSFNIPEFTESIIYKFSTSDIATPPESNNLFVEVSKLVSGGVFSGVINSLTQPTGVNACDIELLVNGQKRSFGSRSNFTSGIVEYEPVNLSAGFCHLNIINVTSNKGINASIEVVAIVKDVDAMNDYHQQKSNEKVAGYVDAITVGIHQRKIEKQQSDWSEASSYNKLGHNKMKRGDYDGAIKIFKKLSAKKNIYSYYGLNGIAIALTKKENYPQSLEYHKKTLKAIKKDKCMKGQAYADMGLTYLAMGNEDEAIECYLKFITNCSGQDIENVKEYLISEIKETESRLGNLKGAEDILSLFE